MPRTAGIAGVVLALGFLCSTAPAFGQIAPQQIAGDIADAIRKDGNVFLGEIQYGELDEAETVRFEINLEHVKRYALYGSCDSDCDGLRLSAADEAGKALDTANDTYPKIEIGGFSGSTIRLEVSMVSCEAEPCTFGIGIAELPGQTTASAADAPLGEEEKARLLDAYKLRVSGEWKQAGDLIFGRLAEGGNKRISLEVDRSNTYRVQADCGQVCTNIDLSVSSGGAQLGSDVASDRIPEVEIGPDASSRGQRTLDIDVKMQSCSNTSCPFVVGVYKTN